MNKVQRLKNWLIASVYLAVILVIVTIGLFMIGVHSLDRS